MNEHDVSFRPILFRYPLQSHRWYGFYAGSSDHEQQLLLAGQQCVLHFNHSGSFLKFSKHKFAFDVESQSQQNEREELVEREVARWRNENGLTDSTIHVCRFEIPELAVSLCDYPPHIEEYLLDKSAFDETEQAEFEESIAEWRRADQFVLNYCNDYWLDITGRVRSS